MAIADAIGDRVFTCAELLAHAQTVSPTLARVLERAGLSTPQQIGKRLQRLHGRDLGGLRLERIGEEHGRAIWRVGVVPDSTPRRLLRPRLTVPTDAHADACFVHPRSDHRAAQPRLCAVLGCLDESRGNALAATVLFKKKWPGAHHDIITKAVTDLEVKAAVLPGDSTTTVWAGALVGVKPFADAFTALARSESLLGRIPRLRVAPFGVKVPTQTGGATYYWIGQGGSEAAVAILVRRRRAAHSDESRRDHRHDERAGAHVGTGRG